MTSREIILANIEHSGAPRPGMTFDCGRMNDMCGVGLGDPEGYKQRRWLEGNVEYYDDIWGNIWMRMKDGCIKGEIHRAAIEDWSQLDKFNPPKYDLNRCIDHLKEGFQMAGDKFKLACVGGWIFDNARYIRKMEVYFMDMVLYPEELKRMHQMISEVYETRIHAAGKAGADGIMIGEDLGTQKGLLFSPAMFQEYFADMYTRLFAIAHEYNMKILMHSCGNNWEIVPDLLKAGIDCFQFDQPKVYDMPLLAKTLAENKAALWSPVDIQKIMPTGDKDIIVQGTKEMLDIFQGGLICKNYPDLLGIGVKEEWDQWAYETMVESLRT